MLDFLPVLGYEWREARVGAWTWWWLSRKFGSALSRRTRSVDLPVILPAVDS